MVIYCRAGFGRTAVDTRATIARQGARYSRKRMAANDVVSVVYLFRGRIGFDGPLQIMVGVV